MMNIGKWNLIGEEMRKLKYYVAIRKETRKAEIVYTHSINSEWVKLIFAFATGPFKNLEKAEAYCNALNNI